MVRTQIQLTDEQYAALRERAAAEKRSMADLIRAGVDSVLGAAAGVDRQARRRRALAVIGRYRSAPPDLSRRHDRYLGKAFR